ncbi:MAG: ribosome maturation factor RimM [Christensenellales bacterium]|jgi:16S rRNA processing protein RimM
MQYLKIGLAVKPHGVRGALRVMPLTHDSKRIYELTRIFLETGGGYQERKLEGASLSGDMAIIKLEGVDSREQAEAFRGQYLYVDREHAVKLPEGTYFIADLVGCEVVGESGRVFGKVADVLQTGANDVYVVAGRREYLMPAIKPLILEISLQERRILIDEKTYREVVPDAD